MNARTTKRWRPSRWAMLSVLALLIGVGFVVSGAGGTQSAQAGFLGICDADMTFPAPADPGGTTSGINYNTAFETPSARDGSDDVNPKTYTVVVPTASQRTPLRQYAGGGLHWYPYAMSCMDAQPQAQTMVVNWVYELVALWPMRLLGLLMMFSFSTVISDALLGAADGIVTNLSTNLWASWSPIIITLVLAGAIIKSARGRGRESFSSLIWIIGVSVVVTGALTGPGLRLLTDLNNRARSITSCVTFATTGAGCGVNDTSTVALYADSMVESLSADVWATGALGDLSTQTPYETNGTWDLVVKHHEGTPGFDDNASVPIPVDAIPAKKPGNPTWAEVLRWTQTYTNAEVTAMRARPDLQCLKSPDESPKSSNVTNLDDGDKWDAGQLCSYKWLVRSALASELYEKHPQAYAAFRGVSQQGWTAAIGGVGLTPLSFGVGIMGFMVFLYQIEFVVLFVASPVVGLISLKNPKAARRWGEMVISALVNRIAVGFTLGITIWLASVANTVFVNSLSGTGGATLLVPLQLVPVATATLTIGCMVVGFMLLKKIQRLFRDGLDLSGQPGVADGLLDKAKTGGKKALEMGVAASAGALAAGSGLHVKGAMRGLTRSNAFGGSIGRAFRTGDQAGFHIQNEQERESQSALKEQAMSEKQRRQDAASASRYESIVETRDSTWSRFEHSSEFLPEGYRDAKETQRSARQSVADQKHRIAEHTASRDEEIRKRSREIADAEGLSPSDAFQRATQAWDNQMREQVDALKNFEQAVERATQTVDVMETERQKRLMPVLSALQQGVAPDAAATHLGLSEQTTAALLSAIKAQRAFDREYPPEV